MGNFVKQRIVISSAKIFKLTWIILSIFKRNDGEMHKSLN